MIIAKGQAIGSFWEYVKNIPAGQGTIEFQSKIEEMRYWELQYQTKIISTKTPIQGVGVRNFCLFIPQTQAMGYIVRIYHILLQNALVKILQQILTSTLARIQRSSKDMRGFQCAGPQ